VQTLLNNNNNNSVKILLKNVKIYSFIKHLIKNGSINYSNQHGITYKNFSYQVPKNK